jgi:hypothetical protein
MRVDYFCDRCNEGRMAFTGHVSLTNPPQHHHRCDVCGWTQVFPVTYPRTEYVQEVSQ